MDSCNSFLRASSSPFDCLIFDLDDTLYSSSIGLGEALKKNIDDFLVEKCGFPESKASSLRVELFKKYGSSLAGLRALGYDIDADDYHSFVHGRLPYDRIKPDHQLRNLIRSIPQRKIIFTNSDRNHALTCLDRLGLNGCFEQIICFETMNPKLAESTRPDEFPVVLKPSMEAMRIAIEAAEVDPRRTLFLDDNVRNITAGRAVGLRTVLVGKTVKSKEADYVLENVKNLAQSISEVWVGGSEGSNQQVNGTRSDIEVDSIRTTTAVVA
ncbi:PREDICTED: uncharacterized protein LOC101301381 [Fragaria vesca subsp. vesca]|uniref:uncharacterized protein LOC101301381 n=1 Tax=Fragaria vesca subsp. vesca TaxID=101020 RepID=UPI0002C33CB1|nr:PREDICTED: uncharacterized protein LOC101301381 [Fragaria vesca subsp. vesca]